MTAERIKKLREECDDLAGSGLSVAIIDECLDAVELANGRQRALEQHLWVETFLKMTGPTATPQLWADNAVRDFRKMFDAKPPLAPTEILGRKVELI